MMVFLKEKLVFFATPKTASTSIEMALGTTCDIRISKVPNAKHTPYRKYQRMLEPFIMTLTGDEPDTVAVIREPIDWLGSWYRYRSRDELKGAKNSTAGVSFDAFVESYLSDSPQPFARIGSQAKFMSDKDGEVGMSHLFRYEDMDGLVRFLQNRLGKQIQLGRANQSPKAELTLSPNLRTELETALAADYDIYNRLRHD
ncbi:sulfotransferase family 2 domain-containing protein [Amylibacter sp. IMCC11727]|uniref:sulfotransferase family 2 domain-containing protein n=1 Tax=Amylibacter sp. IMCC11727 TaxID=3039851 RepID=UPI00244DB27A|nr:sulfotransferase family 2 domain-containing protein [Amylibacter sp. IMCC11727]WGI20504.1 sulfotransferase family 2 domain-containing protein [Amylibacter sp. IMCC11727]